MRVLTRAPDDLRGLRATARAWSEGFSSTSGLVGRVLLGIALLAARLQRTTRISSRADAPPQVAGVDPVGKRAGWRAS